MYFAEQVLYCTANYIVMTVTTSAMNCNHLWINGGNKIELNWNGLLFFWFSTFPVSLSLALYVAAPVYVYLLGVVRSRGPFYVSGVFHKTALIPVLINGKLIQAGTKLPHFMIPFMEPEGSLPCSQEHASGLYSEPDPFSFI
jgi:hypothetical protein